MRFVTEIFNKDTSVNSAILKNIAKYASEEIIITDEKFRLVFNNSKYFHAEKDCSLFDIIGEFLNGDSIINIENFKNSDNNYILLRTVMNNKRDMQKVPVDVHITKVKDKNSNLKGYCIVIQDVTQKIKNIIQRETFFDILTHDLKTPMRANIQVLELLLKNKFGNIDNELKSVLEELLNSCKFMNYMADNLIIKYKNEDKFKDLQKQKYSIVKLVKDKCESLIGVLARRKQTIEFVVKGTIPDTNIDIEKIGNVIKNLIINASEQSIEKSKIVIQIENNEKNVSVSFWDNGYPSNRENPDEIFEEYFTTVNRLRKVGFSLEFSNCKKIIEAHDGKIHAQNIVNRGNIISFSLPLAG